MALIFIPSSPVRLLKSWRHLAKWQQLWRLCRHALVASLDLWRGWSRQFFSNLFADHLKSRRSFICLHSKTHNNAPELKVWLSLSRLIEAICTIWPFGFTENLNFVWLKLLALHLFHKLYRSVKDTQYNPRCCHTLH